MANAEDDQNSVLRQDIIDKISNYLKDEPDKLLSVLVFYTNRDNEKTKWYWYIIILTSVFENDRVFRGMVDKLVEDATNLRNDSSYHRLMAEIWRNYLKPNEIKLGDQQRFDFQLVLSNKNLIKTTFAYNFISTLSKLEPELKNKVIQVIINAAEDSVLAVAFNKNLKKLVQVLKLTSWKIASVGLSVVSLPYDALTSLKLWWTGIITGKRCTENLIDCFIGMAVGIGGGIAGAVAGISIVAEIGVAFGAVTTSVPIAIGSIIGAVIGGVISAKTTFEFSDWLTQRIFNLPKSAAIDNAYRFLELKYGASNDEINSRFMQLALRYHPDKCESLKDWHKLQVAMAVIKLSKCEL